MKKVNKDDFKNFYKAVLSLENIDECEAFFNDVCTIQELEALKQRLDVAILLKQGMSYSDVNKITTASTATIPRNEKRALLSAHFSDLNLKENIGISQMSR